MKIAIISNQASSMLNFRGPLLKEMCRRGYEVLAFAPDFDLDTRATLVAMGVQPIDFSMSRSGVNPMKELAVIWELQHLFQTHRPDLMFAYFLKPVIYGAVAAWLAGVKRRYGLIEGLGFAFTPVSQRDNRRWLIQRLVKLTARFALDRLDKVIFLNSDDLNEFTGLGLVTDKKTALLGAIGVDLAEWSVEKLPPYPITFILVARLLRDKGIGEYVAAARLLREEYPEARFILLGRLDENPAAFSRSEVEGWVTEGLIEWPGHVVVKPWLVESSVFVLPSYYREGVPRSTQEAMALGRPVITTNAPGCRDTVIEGETGFMVHPQDPEPIFLAMRHFMENPADIALMGAAGRRLAEAKFDVYVQNNKLLNYMEI